MQPDGVYPDHGDGFGDYYGVGPEGDPSKRPSTSKHLATRKSVRRSRSHDSGPKSSHRTRSKSRSRSRSRSRSNSRSKSKTRSRSRSDSRSHSRSSRPIELTYKQPTLLDAFRVMYLTSSKHKKSTTKYLSTKKKQDRIQELLKSDGLGSKRWLFYPRVHTQSEPTAGEVPGTRDNVDQRIKVDGDFFRKYKKSKKVDSNAPITKLKRWELVLYKKLGFVQAI
ncbi:hypothetical protein O0L34_g1565 [Tuta absoluta]|nr:hypothetical protein O0L34_g1565 [Tuta absoluta]